MGTVTQITASPAINSDFDHQMQYSLTTVPDPLTVSPAETVELADLVIVGSRISPDPIETNEIAVHLPIGTEAWQLVLDYTGLQSVINLTGWSATPDPANERILFKPSSGHATLTPEQGLTLQLNKLRINRQIGTAPGVIALKWRKPGEGAWKTEEQTLAIGKFPPGFYLRELKAESAYIENGDTVNLTWERSEEATYHLLYENIEIDVTRYSGWPVEDVRRNTMFYLRGRIQQGTATVERTINTYVTVNKPDLDVNKIRVLDELTVENVAKVLKPRSSVAISTTGNPPKARWQPTCDGIAVFVASVAYRGDSYYGIWYVRVGGESTASGATLKAAPNQNATFTIPVRSSESIFVEFKEGVDISQVLVHWHPFGVGELTAVPV